MNQLSTIVVFSHLRWDFVFQRPQHLMVRFAAMRPVLFIEEPIYDPGNAPGWRFSSPTPNVTVARLHTAHAVAGFHVEHESTFASLLPQLLAELHITHYVAWFYTPLAFPLLRSLAPQAVVYDCMDELSAFLYAPPELLVQEQALLDKADLVFTGGASLYRAKKDRHPHVYCFPSSVDVAHFQPSSDRARAIPTDQASIPQPRLGFYGVVDERFDVPLLAALAEDHPTWHFVIVGPVVKIDPARLPRASNIHYIGQRSYAELPAYLDGWDVCLLPFAHNESTRFISPTKTLEYMAAERLIVSTSITDVVEQYSGIVAIADGPVAFGEACAQALAATDDERADHIAKMREVLATTSWDKTAQAMQQLIEQAVVNKGVASQA